MKNPDDTKEWILKLFLFFIFSFYFYFAFFIIFSIFIGFVLEGKFMTRPERPHVGPGKR